MANIVVGLYNYLLPTNGLAPYFHALLNGLTDTGNNVLCFQRRFAKTKDNTKIPDDVLKRIQSFKPDLFVFVCNQFWDVTPYFDQPIIVLDVDSINVFQNLDHLKEKKDRYAYASITQTGVKNIVDIIKAPKDKVRYLQPFTDIQSMTDNKKISIGFCGNFWMWDDFRMIQDFLSTDPTDLERECAKKAFQKFLKFPYKKPQEFYDNADKAIVNKLADDDLYVLTTRVSGIRRLRYLTAIADLGLEIRGQFWSRRIMALTPFPEVLLCYSSKVVNDFATTQEFYNQCKIGFNTKHIQAQSGFSWRCADILASSACLISEQADDFKELGFKVPTFESPNEARDVCKKILDNENMRLDLVHYNNELIDKKYRFKNALPVLEDLCGFPLQKVNKKGCLEMIYTDKKEVPVLPKHKKINFKNKIRYKVWKHLNKKLKKKGII